MGHYANLYLVEVEEIDKDIESSNMVYRNQIGGKAYFCHGSGKRPEGLFPYGNNTVFSDNELQVLPGYPLIQRQTQSDSYLVEANFTPETCDEAVLFHFVLPSNYIPRRDLKPLEQPNIPVLDIVKDKVIITYPVNGPSTIRFQISKMQKDESFEDYVLHKLLTPDIKKNQKEGFEINFGFFKYKREYEL